MFLRVLPLVPSHMCGWLAGYFLVPSMREQGKKVSVSSVGISSRSP